MAGRPPASSGAQLLRVGPAGQFAADTAFAVALIDLWLTVAADPGADAGFAGPPERPEVAARTAPAVESIRRGTADAIAMVDRSRLVGFGRVARGIGPALHTGRLSEVMVHPGYRGAGWGGRIVGRLLELGQDAGIDRFELEVRDGPAPLGFFRRLGFSEWGRLPGWFRVGPGEQRDEVVLGLVVPDDQ